MKIRNYLDKQEVGFASLRVSELIKELNSIEGKQDYFDISELEKARDKMEADIFSYIDRTKEELKIYIEVGKIVKIDTSDGVSCLRSKYFKFTSVDFEKRGEIEFEYLEVVHGEYQNSIEYKKKETSRVDEVLTEFRYIYDSPKSGEVVDKEWEKYYNLITNV